MKKEKQSKKRKALKTILIIVLAFAVPLGSLGLIYNYYLSKINFIGNETTTLGVDPDLTDDFSLTGEDASADEGIDKNISDNRLWYHDKIINVLLIGCDQGSQKLYYPRSDAMIIVSLNKINKKVNIVSLSRAAYVSIPGHGRARLNASYAYGGPALLIDTIELNYKVRIDHFASVDFDGFKNIIDLLGGIDVHLTAAEVAYLDTVFAAEGVSVSKGAGTYHLNGTMALAYVRTRAIDTDRARTARQRTVLTKIAQKARNMSASQALRLLNEFLPLVSTDFTKAGLTGQLVAALSYVRWPISQAIIPSVAPSLIMVGKQEVLILNWDVVKTDIHAILYPGIEPKEPPAD